MSDEIRKEILLRPLRRMTGREARRLELGYEAFLRFGPRATPVVRAMWETMDARVHDKVEFLTEVGRRLKNGG